MPNEPTGPSGLGEPPVPEAPRRLRFTRRRLLIVGGAAAAGVAATVAGIRGWGDSGAGDSDSPADGSLAENDRRRIGFPVLSVEPPPDVPVEEWILKVDGLVERPLTVDRATWSGLQRITETADLDCVTGWTAENVRWGGVPPSVLLEQAGLRPEARYAVFHAFRHLGGGYSSGLPLDLVTAPDTLLADALDGDILPSKHGGPLRLVVPQQLGHKSVKWVVRIEITDAPVPGYWEQRGYPDDAPARGG